MASEITLRAFRISKNYLGSDFQDVYESLVLGDDGKITDEKRLKILKWAIYFLNKGDDGVRRLGYRMLVRYANLFKDYIPLYDAALALGFIPVAAFIEKNFFGGVRDGEVIRDLMVAYKSIFKDGDRFLSEGQRELVEFNKGEEGDSLIVAPTSYGKSEMMISKVSDNLDNKVCIIAPSKALLAQTKRRLLENEKISVGAKRVLTHPEMFGKGERAEKSFVAVLTQERISRLLKSEPDFGVDILLVDEAHNLISGDDRGILLLQVILILKHRNPNMELRFYTPFIADERSLQTPYSKYSIKAAKTREFIKIEKYFIYDLDADGDLSLYDQFMGRAVGLNKLGLGEIDFIRHYAAGKNIVYLNKPRDVESVALSISAAIGDDGMNISGSNDFDEAYSAISDFLHPEYKLLGCLKKGVIYHHGKMPEIIRLYVESLFSKNKNFSFIVSSSTLLEGVNIPAEKMFILSPKKGRKNLSRSAFRNLTGRVCRFSEVFSGERSDLRMLEPEIYIIKGRYFGNQTSPENFLEGRAKVYEHSKDKDDVDNILLKDNPEGDERSKVRDALEYIENIERGAVEQGIEEREVGEIRYAESPIAVACFKNNIHDFDIYSNEFALNKNFLLAQDEGVIRDVGDLLDTISNVFISGVVFRDEFDEFARLSNPAARSFYSMILDWKMNGAAYSKMIHSFLSYWADLETRDQSGQGVKVYVGNAWGEIKWSEEEHIPRYVNIKEKDIGQRVNLAIVKIKEEQDFVEFKLMKYIDALFDLEVVEQRLYDQIKYGSTDPKIICLMKNGISMELAKILLGEEYRQFLIFDALGDEVVIQKEAVNQMIVNGENRVLVFELQFHAV